MTAQKTIKMLSIDDKTLTTDLDRAGYRKMGVYVKPASTYDEAARLLKVEAVDLIVINMDYKPVDACMMTKHFKAQAEYKDLPIVLTSVQTAAKVRNSALEAGADLFVEQPLPRQYFIEKLKQLLEHKTRSTERVDVQAMVHFEYNGQNHSCSIGDLSVSGILLATDLELKDGAQITVAFEIPGSKKMIRIDGEVVRTIKRQDATRSAGVGIRFQEFHGDAKKRLEKYVEKSSHTDSQMLYYL